MNQLSFYKTKNIMTAGLIALFILSLGFQSCDEVEDILKKIEVFAFDYRIVSSSSYTTAQAISLIETQDSNFINGMTRFTPEDPASGGTGASNTARMFGDPSQSGSSFQIIMERESTSDLEYARTISITSPQGPFTEGQIISNATVDVTTGLLSGGRTYNSSQPDINVKIKITTVNTVSKKFGGEFYFVLRDTNQPATSDFLCGANGTFLFNY